MSYAQGGIIAAADYNGIVGTATTAGTLNYLWSTGNGSTGYGQTAIGQVSQNGTVTATQWASAINALNSAKTHQSGSGTGISAPTAGSTIAYLSTLNSSLTTALSNKLTAASQGTTTTGSVYSPAQTAGNDATLTETTVLTRNVTFASADQARYFFNAGGQINFVITSVTNNDGTGRSADMATVIATNLGGVSAFKATTNGGRTGSGGTATTNNTSFGYYNLSGTWVATQHIASSSGTYTNDYAKVYYKSNGTQGSNGDTGTQINIALNIYSAHTTYGAGFNDTLNITINHRVDIVYPETTNLTNSWGTVTIS